MNESLDILVQHRDTILLAEVGALLHDLGKLDSRFIIQHSADRPSNFKKYEHERILKDLPALQSLLSNKFFTEKLVELGNVVSELAPSNRKADLSLDRIISKHHDNVSKSPIGYYKLISASTRGVDGVDSGIDKGAVSNKAKQALANTYIATAFGSEEKRIDANALKSLQDKFVKTLNSELNKGITTPSKLVNVRSAIISAAEKAYLQVLGETRRAANDVTLWDHSYSVASLYKAALAKILLDSQWTDPAKLQWRILRISFDGLSFLNNVHRVTDILGRQKAVTNALDNLKKLLELEYPLGNEIYRDENGSAFVVPDISDLLDRVNKNNKSLRGLIEEAFAQSDLKEELKLILSPQAFSEPSRGAILLGKLLAQHVPPLTTDPNVAKGWWDNKVGEVCTVCTLRPMGYDPDNPDGIDEKAKDRHVCHVCLERRGRRSQEWATKGLNATIWIDEAADIYARLALIVGRFHLDNWLNGAFTDTIFTQALAVHGLSYDQLINGLKEALTGKNTGILDIVGGDAWESFKSKKLKSGLSTNKVKSLIEEFYQAIVDDRDVRELSKNVSTLDDRAKLFALFLFRKHPSFARLRRIWETTQDFWVDVAEGRDGQTSLIAEVIEPTGPRLKITATNLQELDLGLYHAYDLLLNGMRFSVVWTPHLNGFITVENLCYIAKQLGAAGQKWEKAEAAASFIKDKLSGDIEIEEPPGYGIKAKKKGTLKGLSTELLKNAQGQPITYTPAIPILTEPRTFMALVPANKALEVVAKIKENYETEMGKVRNRLSLTLGIIYFHRRTPLRAALEAGRQMLKIPTEQKVWKVQKIDHNAVYFNNGSKWGVPITLGDGNLDYYYPYFFVKTPAQDHPLDQRPNRFESYRPTPNGNERCWLVHVSELKPGDEVWVIPSQFDFEFLDTSARRFEICYGNNGRRRGFHQNRPYLLEDLDVLKQLWKLLAGENGLTTTQINALTGLIEAKREMWRYPTNDAQKDKVFEQLVKDALARAEWPNGWINIPAESRTLLEKAAINGVLTDVLELYMELMKEKPKRT